MQELIASEKGNTLSTHATPRPNSYSRTRSDHASELAEDYVEAIAELSRDEGVCRAVDLAERFQVSHVTVNRTIKRLIRDGWATSEPYGPVLLTEAGEKLARESAEKHRIVLDFLISLGVSRQVAEHDSEGMEHHCSRETLRAMKRFLNSSS